MNFYHLLILDASGSMGCIRQQAISGCNETIQSVRSLQEQQPDNRHYLSLVVFNSSNRTNTLIDCQPAAEVSDIPDHAYRPNGCTPLYDCMGLSICRLQDKLGGSPMENNEVIVTVITDGMENASTIFDAQRLKSLVEECKQQGWTFAFIGANQDEVMEAGKIGIHNTMSFEQDEAGSKKMFRDYAESTMMFCMDSAPKSAAMRDSGFFKQEKKTRK